ncbi:ATP-grasp domain-containing protein [Candidatus Uabimicrobium sp. HlEnr_7]|uniref:ATP-grasp domain-containing protein n=1 Tax=Candidatus Uabimicrobium helgolandensis TaxID=3095367 RepID=UPI003557223A
MIVFSEHTTLNSESARDLEQVTKVAQASGCRVYFIPSDFDDCGDAEGALCYVPQQQIPKKAVYIGYIPTIERYNEIYNAAKQKNIYLVNSPQEYALAEHFHLYYSSIEDLTPKSYFLTDETMIDELDLTFPVFVKGTILSLKSLGIGIVHDKEQLRKVAHDLFCKYKKQTVGNVIVREYAKLRHVRTSKLGFPFGREYRVFLYKGEVLSYGYYWDGEDELSKLSATEESEVLYLAQKAAKRISTPYIAIDIGQLESRKWIVIEMGDGQFCGATHVPLFQLWNELLAKVRKF